jgi:uncharacterized membrane protein
MKRLLLLERFRSLLARLKISHLILGFIILYFLLGAYRHFVFHSAAWDMGIFAQASWQYSRWEMGYNSVRAVGPLLADHFHPILMAIGPLYRIWPQPYLLLIVQAFSTAIAAWPIYKVAKRRLDDEFLARALSLSYLCFWGVLGAITFDFHPIVLILPFLAFAYYFLEEGKKVPLLFMVLCMLLIEEDMILTVLAFGLYLLIFRREWFTGTAISIVSLGWFLAVTQVIIPGIRTSDYLYWQHYAYLGPTMGAAILKLITHPYLLIKYLFIPKIKIALILALLAPFCMLPLLGSFSLVGLPYLVQRLLSDYSAHWKFSYHYNALFGVILTFATVEAICFLRDRGQGGRLAKLERWRAVNGGFTGLYVILFGILTLFTYLCGFFIVTPLSNIALAQEGNKLLNNIPPDAFVLAQDTVVAHLANREDIYLYGEEPFSEHMSYTNLELGLLYQQRDLIAEADYIILNPNLPCFPTVKEQVKRRIQLLLEDPRFIAHPYRFGWIYFERKK